MRTLFSTAQLLAAEVREAGHDSLLINAYCPGRVTTDMLRQSTDNARTPDEGAAQGLAMALLPPLSTVSLTMITPCADDAPAPAGTFFLRAPIAHRAYIVGISRSTVDCSFFLRIVDL